MATTLPSRAASAAFAARNGVNTPSIEGIVATVCDIAKAANARAAESCIAVLL